MIDKIKEKMKELNWSDEDVKNMIKTLPLGVFDFWDLVEIYKK